MIDILFLLALTFITGLTSGTILSIVVKYDLHNKYELHRKSWMPEACLFCLGFWLGWPIIWALLELSGESFHNLYLFAGFAASPIARLVVK